MNDLPICPKCGYVRLSFEELAQAVSTTEEFQKVALSGLCEKTDNIFCLKKQVELYKVMKKGVETRLADLHQNEQKLRKAVQQALAFALNWQPDEPGPFTQQCGKIAFEMSEALGEHKPFIRK